MMKRVWRKKQAEWYNCVDNTDIDIQCGPNSIQRICRCHSCCVCHNPREDEAESVHILVLENQEEWLFNRRRVTAMTGCYGYLLKFQSWPSTFEFWLSSTHTAPCSDGRRIRCFNCHPFQTNVWGASKRSAHIRKSITFCWQTPTFNPKPRWPRDTPTAKNVVYQQVLSWILKV